MRNLDECRNESVYYTQFGEFFSHDQKYKIVENCDNKTVSVYFIVNSEYIPYTSKMLFTSLNHNFSNNW